MKGCVFVTGADCQYGFSLAGFQQILADKENILEVLKQIIKDNAAGLVFIDERLLAEHIMGRLRLLEKQWGGAFIALPAPGKLGEAIEKDTGRRFISRVLGYQMKLN